MLVPLVLIGLTHKWVACRGSLLLMISNLPMTIMHELAHFTVALLLGGNPSAISIWPVRNGKRWQLGNVTFRPTVLSTAPTALAPLLWLIVGGYLLLNKNGLAEGSLAWLCGIYLCAYVCISASIPSTQDIRIILRNPMSLMVWASVFYCLVHFSLLLSGE
ncbi:hypothetical protein [Pelotalea chapellei]|uniref:Peptidase M50B-like protein n=1 Tax=Pelotalea chapellei TaxID=44671 RepID=A0ABS5U9V3_9BACT|nr:hypothetical protein [Pelotalea chapellei]MBT1072413.1 hypothetical protein [Pelotalea chapellei]